MKKIVSVLLTLVLLFSAVPFAFAADDASNAVVAYGYFSPINTGSSLLYLIMDSAYTKTTAALSATVTVQDGIDRRQVAFSAEQLLAERVAFADGETTVQRYLLLVPLGSIDAENVRGLTLPAKSFAGSKKLKSPQLRLGMPEALCITEDLTFTSRLFRETKPLPQPNDLQVGVGDTLHLNASCDLPFSYWLGTSRLASCNGGTLQQDVKAESAGAKTLSLRVFSYVLTEHSFDVRKQTDLYRDAVLGFYEYVGTVLLSPVIAPISSLFAGPLNIAAMLSPAMLLKTNPVEVFKIFFSIFNLIRP